jgi:hypothetical protein
MYAMQTIFVHTNARMHTHARARTDCTHGHAAKNTPIVLVVEAGGNGGKGGARSPVPWTAGL